MVNHLQQRKVTFLQLVKLMTHNEQIWSVEEETAGVENTLPVQDVDNTVREKILNHLLHNLVLSMFQLMNFFTNTIIHILIKGAQEEPDHV